MEKKGEWVEELAKLCDLEYQKRRTDQQMKNE